jgi:hypothetical protein
VNLHSVGLFALESFDGGESWELFATGGNWSEVCTTAGTVN